jgi:hypothetical protein
MPLQKLDKVERAERIERPDRIVVPRPRKAGQGGLECKKPATG